MNSGETDKASKLLKNVIENKETILIPNTTHWFKGSRASALKSYLIGHQWKPEYFPFTSKMINPILSSIRGLIDKDITSEVIELNKPKNIRALVAKVQGLPFSAKKEIYRGLLRASRTAGGTPLGFTLLSSIEERPNRLRSLYRKYKNIPNNLISTTYQPYTRQSNIIEGLLSGNFFPLAGPSSNGIYFGEGLPEFGFKLWYNPSADMTITKFSRNARLFIPNEIPDGTWPTEQAVAHLAALSKYPSLTIKDFVPWAHPPIPELKALFISELKKQNPGKSYHEINSLLEQELEKVWTRFLDAPVPDKGHKTINFLDLVNEGL